MFLYLWNFCTDIKDSVMNSARSGSIERFYFISPWSVMSECFAHIAFAVFLKLERLMR